MKASVIGLLSLMVGFGSVQAVAQTNIKAAFDAIIKCSQAEVTESHMLDKDPSSGAKTGQRDVYRFVIPASKAKLVEKAYAAFDKDQDKAYSINRGKAAGADNQILLTVGDGGADDVYINKPGNDYVYSLFLAPAEDDPRGIYRYAYAMNSREENGNIEGNLVVTYATTLKYRQEEAQQRQYKTLRSLSGNTYFNSDSDSEQKEWFDVLMTYFQGMTSASTQTRIALATKAFKVIRDTSKYPEVTKADKDAVREILKGMIADKKYSESVLNRLLNQCLTELK